MCIGHKPRELVTPTDHCYLPQTTASFLRPLLSPFFNNYLFLSFIFNKSIGTEHKDIKHKSHIISLSSLLCLASNQIGNLFRPLISP